MPEKRNTVFSDILFLLTVNCVLLTILSGCATVEYAGRPAQVSAPQKIVQPSRGLHHRVQKGQTLWKIARIYGVNIEEILRANNIADSTMIASGQSIFIPDARTALSSDPLNVGPAEDFIWPAKGSIVRGFGDKVGNAPSKGLTLRLYTQSDIVAAASGRVVFADERFRAYGKTVIISHPEGLMSVYASLSRISVRPGDYINRGTIIGKGAGLMHFQIRKGSLAQNPYYYLPR